MSPDLKGRSLLNLLDFTEQEVLYLLQLAATLKEEKRSGTEAPRLRGRNIALIFEKDSTRTRTSFEVAAYDQGAHVTYLGPTGSQIGRKESMKDTARVLGRIYDAIQYRGFAQENVETLSTWSGVPVYNGLTDTFHPTQILADFLTMQEHAGRPLEEIAFCFLGDAANNMGNSLLTGAALMGMDVRLGGPKQCWPEPALIEESHRIAARTGARILLSEDPVEAARGCDFVYTDVWVSMGEPESVWAERIELLSPYRVTSEIMAATGKAEARFMHCLPAFHDRETEIGESIFQKYGIDSMEVTGEVFESAASIVFDQSENRMHTIKAVMVATLAG